MADIKAQMDALFGELRSLLSKGFYEYRDDLVDLIEQAAELSGDIYESEWVPYLGTFVDRWSMLKVDSVERFEKVASLLPGAMFDLDLRYGKINSQGLIAFAQSPHLSRIQKLELGSNDLNAQAIEALMASPLLNSVHTLHVDINKIGDRGAQAIGQAPHLASLRRLAITYNQIGDVGFEAIVTSPHLTNLQQLYCDENRITIKGVQTLANSPQASALKDLDLSYNSVGDVGAQALADSPFLSLEGLGLNSCDLTAEGKRIMQRASIMSNLYRLEMNYND